MTTDPKPVDLEHADPPNHPTAKPRKPVFLQFPGLVAISIYMLLLAALAVVYVVQGQIGFVYLVFSVLFIASALGLLLLLRWAWALALAGMALMTGTFLYRFASQHALVFLLQGLLNLVFFLYLVRTDVREKLK
jgi:hypothetical protein